FLVFMLIVYNTCLDKEVAEKIAKHLIQNKLAACINLIKIEKSIYEWKGKLCEEPEYLLMIKIKDSNYAAIEKEIKKLHSYETTEIIAVKVEKGIKEYVDWVDEP
ncbi:MAG: divalent-cation tolerance protein CutA, partial [Candidatus Micrarchaeota archaeon]